MVSMCENLRGRRAELSVGDDFWSGDASRWMEVPVNGEAERDKWWNEWLQDRVEHGDATRRVKGGKKKSERGKKKMILAWPGVEPGVMYKTVDRRFMDMDARRLVAPALNCTRVAVTPPGTLNSFVCCLKTPPF